MRALAILCTLILLSSGSRATAAGATGVAPRPLFITYEGGKYGLIDAQGRVVVPPIFLVAGVDSAGFTVMHHSWGSDGAAWIDDHGRVMAPASDFWRTLVRTYGLPTVPSSSPVVVIENAGYLVHEGGTAERLPFHQVHTFREGAAPAAQGSSWGFIDAAGKTMVPPRFDHVQPFSEGLAVVQRGMRFGYVDRRGALAIRLRFAWASPFSGGRAVVTMPNGNCSWVLPDGSLRTLPGSWHFEHFSLPEGGTVHVTEVDGPQGGRGMLDSAGTLIGGQWFDSICRIGDARWAVVEKAKRFRYLDLVKRRIVPPEAWVDGTRWFSEGLAAVRVERLWGYLDESGAFVVAPRWDDAREFHEGLAAVEEFGRWGFVDRTGRVAIPPTYNDVGAFSHGLAPVHRTALVKTGYGEWSYIDRAGRVVWEPRANSFAGVTGRASAPGDVVAAPFTAAVEAIVEASRFRITVTATLRDGDLPTVGACAALFDETSPGDVRLRGSGFIVDVAGGVVTFKARIFGDGIGRAGSEAAGRRWFVSSRQLERDLDLTSEGWRSVTVEGIPPVGSPVSLVERILPPPESRRVRGDELLEVHWLPLTRNGDALAKVFLRKGRLEAILPMPHQGLE